MRAATPTTSAGSPADQGRTDIDNLILVCPRHHTLIHAELWTPHLNGDDTVTWTHHRTGRQETRHPPRSDPLTITLAT